MEPKFQSSFIPKGPITSTASSFSTRPKIKEKGLLAFLSLVIFIISVLLAVGIFGYKFYLKYRIEQMGSDLEKTLVTIRPEPKIIRELIRFDNRLASTKELISKHYILTPLFEFLEISPPVTVRFNNFSYVMNEQGLKLSIRGEARGYAAVALQADIFNKSSYFKNLVFSNLTLNEKGDVNFSLEATVDDNLVSYHRMVEGITPAIEPANQSVATSTAISA